MRPMASSSSTKGIVAVVGVGPKLGLSIARKFAHEGYTVAILARDLGMSFAYLNFIHLVLYYYTCSSCFFVFLSTSFASMLVSCSFLVIGKLSRFADEIAREEKAQVFAIRIDCSDARSVREAFEGVHSLGFVEVLVYNACQPVSWNMPKFADIRLDSFEKSLAVSTVGAFHCAQQVVILSITPTSNS